MIGALFSEMTLWRSVKARCHNGLRFAGLGGLLLWGARAGADETSFPRRVAATVQATLAMPGYARHVAVRGGFAAVSLGADGLALVDARVATNPVQADFLPLSYPQEARGAAFISDYLYVPLWGRQGWGWRTETAVYDVTDPWQMEKVGSAVTNGLAWSVAVGADRVYVGVLKLYPTYIGGFVGSVVEVYDASEPANPVALHTLEGFSFSREVSVAGNRLLVADLQSGAALVDLPDIGSSMARHASLSDWQDGGSAVYSLAAGTSTIYAACGADGLWVLDARDPEQPVFTNSVWLPGCARSVVLWSNFLAVAVGSEGVSFLDASAPFAPVDAGWLAVTGTAEAVVVEGDRLYIADGEGGLVIATLVDDDADLDGLSDEWERARFESLDWKGADDPDEDDLTNEQEQRLGSDPDDPASALRIGRADWQDAFPIIGWSSVGGHRYDIEYSTNLLMPGGGFVWLERVAEIAPFGSWTNRSVVHDMPLPAGVSRFYRVRLAP